MQGGLPRFGHGYGTEAAGGVGEDFSDVQMLRLPVAPLRRRETDEAAARSEEQPAAGRGAGGTVGILVQRVAAVFLVDFPDGQVVGIEFDDPVGGREPDDLVQVFLDAAGDGAGKAVMAGDGPEPELPGGDLVKPGEAGAARLREHPEPVMAVLADAGDVVGCQPERLVVLGDMREIPVFPHPEAVAVGPDPKIAPRVLVDGVDERAAELGAGLEAVLRPVIQVQAGGRP